MLWPPMRCQPGTCGPPESNRNSVDSYGEKSDQCGGRQEQHKPMKTITITLSTEQMKRLADLLADSASQIEDDGNEGHPDALLLWQIQKLARQA
jgi:hypothetical protein